MKKYELTRYELVKVRVDHKPNHVMCFFRSIFLQFIEDRNNVIWEDKSECSKHSPITKCRFNGQFVLISRILFFFFVKSGFRCDNWSKKSSEDYYFYFRPSVAPEAFFFDQMSHLNHFLDEVTLRRNGQSAKWSVCEMVSRPRNGFRRKVGHPMQSYKRTPNIFYASSESRN